MRIAFPSLFAVPLFAACVAPTPGNVRQVPDPVSTRYINRNLGPVYRRTDSG